MHQAHQVPTLSPTAPASCTHAHVLNFYALQRQSSHYHRQQKTSNSQKVTPPFWHHSHSPSTWSQSVRPAQSYLLHSTSRSTPISKQINIFSHPDIFPPPLHCCGVRRGGVCVSTFRQWCAGSFITDIEKRPETAGGITSGVYFYHTALARFSHTQVPFLILAGSTRPCRLLIRSIQTYAVVTQHTTT